MHIQAWEFTQFAKAVFPDSFHQKVVLDVGAGDINGNNRVLFTECNYTGNDVIAADNVTIVSKTKDLPFADATFDTIISTECFEHDPEYEDSFRKIYTLLKPGGLFVFTCASTGRPEHGTRRTTPQDSYGTIGNLVDMQDYYKNLTHQDVNAVLAFNECFEKWDTYYESRNKDLFFIGIKKRSDKQNLLKFPVYVKPNVVHTSAEIIQD